MSLSAWLTAQASLHDKMLSAGPTTTDLRALSLISLERSPTLHSQYSLFLSLNHFLKHTLLRLYIQFYFVFLTVNSVKVF